MCPRGRPRGQGLPIGKSRFSRKKFLFTLERTIHAYKKCWSTLNDEVENVLNFFKISNQNGVSTAPPCRSALLK